MLLEGNKHNFIKIDNKINNNCIFMMKNANTSQIEKHDELP